MYTYGRRERKNILEESILETIKKYFRQINSISFLEVRNDEGETVFFIPSWVVIAVLVFLVFLRRSRRNRRVS